MALYADGRQETIIIEQPAYNPYRYFVYPAEGAGENTASFLLGPSLGSDHPSD